MIRVLAIVLFALLAACSEPSPYKISGDGIPQALTDETPNAARGARLFGERGDAHCVLCHQHKKSQAEFQGNLGPDLSDISLRLSASQIRLRIVDYDAVKPGTTMPSYFRTKDFNEVEPKFVNKTVLTPLEIEDIIAFLVADENDAKN